MLAQAFDLPQPELPPVERRHPVVEHPERRREIVGGRAQIHGEEVTNVDDAVAPVGIGGGQEIPDLRAEDVVDRKTDRKRGCEAHQIVCA